MSITIDFETKSQSDLKKVGAWAYSEHPSTDVICVCWGIDNQPIQSWYPGKNATDEMPKDLRIAIVLGHCVEAHNVAFEYSVWANVLAPKYGWMLPLDHQWRDTMAAAAYMAMPTGLDRLAYALKFQGKDAEGARLISKYSKLHLKTAKSIIPPEDLMKFVAYCEQDVRIEQSVGDYLGDLPDAEVEIFLLDQIINKRGIYLDLAGIENATAVVEMRSADLEEEFKRLTGGIGPTKREQLLVWFAGQGLTLENMQAEYLEELLEDGEVPAGPARRALQIRLAINKASTKKLDAMARQRGADGRARFQSRYHGAATGRWTGSGFQPLNLNRGFEDVPPNELVENIAERDPKLLDLIYGDAMDAVAKASRHWLMAQPGYDIISGDFVSIEAVILACLAGEEWKVDAFRRGVKIYEHMADKIFKLEPGTVTKHSHPAERQDGKTCLGAGTQVLTRRGWRSIVNVRFDDQLWDGISWVNHAGLHYQGRQKTLTLAGLEITAEHRILTPAGWVPAEVVASRASILSRALEIGSANLPLQGLSGGLLVASSGCGFAALAEQENISSPRAISGPASLRDAMDALKTNLLDHGKISLNTPIYAPTTSIVAVSSTGSLLASPAAGLMDIRTTDNVASMSSPNGSTGRKVDADIWPIFSRLKAGIIRRWKWIVSKLTKVTSLETYASTNAAKGRSDQSESCKVASQNLKPVYDLANAGPLRRFTVLTKQGPIIVHNCELAFGYQGALGAWLKFDSSGRHSDERIIEICRAWRSEHPAIVQFWRDLDWAAINAVRNGTKADPVMVRQIGFQMVDEWLSMILPDGKRIWYYDPQIRMKMPQWHKPGPEVDEAGAIVCDDAQQPIMNECARGVCDCKPQPYLSYMAQKEGQWKRVATYGGKLAENATQATSRQILVPAMLAAEKAGYKIILSVYDEIVAEIPESFGSVEEFKEIMAIRPAWASDWPISVDAWRGKRYRK